MKRAAAGSAAAVSSGRSHSGSRFYLQVFEAHGIRVAPPAEEERRLGA